MSNEVNQMTLEIDRCIEQVEGNSDVLFSMLMIIRGSAEQNDVPRLWELMKMYAKASIYDIERASNA